MEKNILEFKKGPKRLLFIRHPESLKNVNDIHGGTGNTLTDSGRSDAASIADYLGSKNLENCVVMGNNSLQIRETIEIINLKLNFPVFLTEKIKGLDLGVLSGLSKIEAAEKYPQAADKLEQWRKGRLGIDRLDLPEGEPIVAFRERLDGFIGEALSLKYETYIFIITTSVMIFYINYFVLGRSFSFDDYKIYTIPNCSMSEFAMDKDEKVTVGSINDIGYASFHKIT